MLEHGGQLVEALREVLARRVGRLGERAREAPDLPALLLRHVPERLDEARDEVALGEEHVDREAQRELRLHLVDALADAPRELRDVVLAGAADVADEIKNPLTSLRSAVETAARVEDADQQRKLMAIIKQDVDRLDRLISDISNASRLDAELSRGEMAPLDLGQQLPSPL